MLLVVLWTRLMLFSYVLAILVLDGQNLSIFKYFEQICEQNNYVRNVLKQKIWLYKNGLLLQCEFEGDDEASIVSGSSCQWY